MGHSRRAIAFLCLSGVLLSGCGGDPLGRHAISGTVTLDGAPVENGTISFQPVDQGTTSSGTAFTGGTYSLSQENGLPVGKYLVTINAPKPGTGGTPSPDALPGDPLPPPQELIPPEWNVKSDQTIEVKEGGPFEFNFEIVTKRR
ncbi:MAG: carboxypeptidase regulatory-like domain-containing protein [Planctomycetes bacterium]|nr:carboxypeptidase regulatory-like domain-containing protein [Planctomycetota bacterium]